MRKLTLKHKVYLLQAIIIILSLLADMFDLLELNLYNGLWVMLLLTILFCGIYYYAALQGLSTLLSIDQEYKIRKLWNIEHQFDWEKVRKNQLKFAPFIIILSLIEVFILLLTGKKYTIPLFIIWVISILTHSLFT